MKDSTVVYYTDDCIIFENFCIGYFLVPILRPFLEY